MLLAEILVRQGKAKPEQLDPLLKRGSSSEQELGDVLLDEGIVSDTDLVIALGEIYDADVVTTVGDEMLDSKLVQDLPVEWARNHAVLPVRFGGQVAALTSNPSDMATIDDLGLLLDMELTPVLATRREITRAIERCYFQKDDSTQSFLDTMNLQHETPLKISRSDDLLKHVDEAPVTQFVNLILLEALKARASDVHIEPFENHLKVRYRVDGMLYEQTQPPKHIEASLVSRLKVMARLDIAERRLPQDGMARVRVGEREVDIRVSTIPVAEGERLVLRLLNRDSALLPLTDLGMPDTLLQEFRTILEEPQGIILVTGPTGSGKTTTLYAALRELDTKHANVLTIEDPIEYQLPDIGQIQVKPKIGLSFAQGLRHILRQDPDIILVGEIRDLETAEISVRASLTGHLVFSTLHTNDAVGAVMRLTDMGIEPYLLAAAIKASLAQRLVRELCDNCKEQRYATDEELADLAPWRDRIAAKPTWHPVGCPSCMNGYLGRTGIYEFMVASASVREAVREGIGLQDLRTMAREQGMRTMMDDGIDKAIEGVTSLAEIRRVAGRMSAEQ